MFNIVKKYHFVISVTIFIITILIMIFSHSRKNYDYIFSSLFHRITYPFILGAQISSDYINNNLMKFKEFVLAQKFNEELLIEVKQLKTENLELLQQIQKLESLKQAIEFSDNISVEKIYGNIIAEVQNDYSRIFIVNRGKADGVAINQGVISYDGVVGKIIRTTKNESIIQLITDIQSKIPVIIEKNKTRSLIQGDGINGVLLKSIPREEIIETGDAIVTSDTNSIFPGKFKIGNIESIYKKEFGWFQEAIITPAVNFDKIEDVFILPNHNLEKALQIINQTNIE